MLIFLLIVLIIGGAVAYFSMFPQVETSMLARINQRKENIASSMIREWSMTRALGTEEDVQQWFKRKLPILEDEWLEASRALGLSDDTLIRRALAHVHSKPEMIEYFLKPEEEEALEE